jgi:procollagen-lysine,2-oxoglutarate 5-dioxygenase, invertebrate
LKTPIKDEDDDQLYYTKAFLNKELRDSENIRLDNTAIVFQNLNGAIGRINDFCYRLPAKILNLLDYIFTCKAQVTLSFDADTGEAYVFNNDFKTTPAVVHGNGASKLTLNSFGNYLAGAFDNGNCKVCEEDVLTLDVSNRLVNGNVKLTLNLNRTGQKVTNSYDGCLCRKTYTIFGRIFK